MKLLKTFVSAIAFLFLISQPACITTNSIFSNSSIAPRSSFVKLVFVEKEQVMSSASGIIIDHIGNTSIILTAGHVCTPLEHTPYAMSIDADIYELVVLKISGTSDLCLLGSLKTIPLPAVKVAKSMIKPGDRAYNLSAPFGIYDKNMVLEFEGFYSGRTTRPNFGYELDLYTIPTRSGSSGSPIFNEKWEIIGIASMSINNLENVGLMVTLDDIHRFLD